MAAKKRKTKKRKIRCKGQIGPGGKRIRKSTCKRSRCKGQMNGSKNGKPRRRKTSVCLKPKRKKVARKRPAAKRRVARKRTKGVMSHGRRVYGAAAKAVKRKRARKGKAPAKRRATPKRHRAWRGSAGASIGSISREQARIEHELREINRDLKDLRSY